MGIFTGGDPSVENFRGDLTVRECGEDLSGGLQDTASHLLLTTVFLSLEGLVNSSLVGSVTPHPAWVNQSLEFRRSMRRNSRSAERA